MARRAGVARGARAPGGSGAAWHRASPGSPRTPPVLPLARPPTFHRGLCPRLRSLPAPSPRQCLPPLFGKHHPWGVAGGTGARRWPCWVSRPSALGAGASLCSPGLWAELGPGGRAAGICPSGAAGREDERQGRCPSPSPRGGRQGWPCSPAEATRESEPMRLVLVGWVFSSPLCFPVCVFCGWFFRFSFLSLLRVCLCVCLFSRAVSWRRGVLALIFHQKRGPGAGCTAPWDSWDDEEEASWEAFVIQDTRTGQAAGWPGRRPARRDL